MSRRRKSKGNAANGPRHGAGLSTLQSAVPSVPTLFTIGAYREARNVPSLSDVFKGAIERAMDKAKNELASKGKLSSTAFFVHTDGTMKAVSLSLRGEHQKEALIRRIREKTIAENASVVMVLTEMDRDRQAMVLVGVTPGSSASVRVRYSFDKGTRTVTLWETCWLERPIRNTFLDDIFSKTGARA